MTGTPTNVVTGKIIRWAQHLDPKINKSEWTFDESIKLFELHNQLPRRWKLIALHFKGKTNHAVKNQFYSIVRRAVRQATKLLYNDPKSVEINLIRPKILANYVTLEYEDVAGPGKERTETIKKIIVRDIIHKFAFTRIKDLVTTLEQEDLIVVQKCLELLHALNKSYLTKKGKINAIKAVKSKLRKSERDLLFLNNEAKPICSPRLNRKTFREKYIPLKNRAEGFKNSFYVSKNSDMLMSFEVRNMNVSENQVVGYLSNSLTETPNFEYEGKNNLNYLSSLVKISEKSSKTHGFHYKMQTIVPAPHEFKRHDSNNGDKNHEENIFPQITTRDHRKKALGQINTEIGAVFSHPSTQNINNVYSYLPQVEPNGETLNKFNKNTSKYYLNDKAPTDNGDTPKVISRLTKPFNFPRMLKPQSDSSIELALEKRQLEFVYQEAKRTGDDSSLTDVGVYGMNIKT